MHSGVAARETVRTFSKNLYYNVILMPKVHYRLYSVYSGSLINLPALTIAPLRRVQNTAARLVLGLDRRSSITSALHELHWLPVH